MSLILLTVTIIGRKKPTKGDLGAKETTDFINEVKGRFRDKVCKGRDGKSPKLLL